LFFERARIIVEILSLNRVDRFSFLVIASNCLLVVDVFSFARCHYVRYVYKHLRKLNKPHVLWSK